jgi:nicotinamidase-related amidase
MRKASAALLMIDFFNPLDFEGANSLAPPALRAARRTASLKTRLRRAGVPAIYANDNFGHWESEFSALVLQCQKMPGVPGEIARLLTPAAGDRSILKPRHSAFFGTPLDFLLDELQVRRLILTGLTTDNCITFTASDAYLRKFELWIPGDCVAAIKPEFQRAALAHMKRVLKASVKGAAAPLTAAFASSRR